MALLATLIAPVAVALVRNSFVVGERLARAADSRGLTGAAD